MIETPPRRSSDTGTVDADNPWPGLAAFREADCHYFQGRETVVDELARLVLRARVTVLHGVSGLGKTSVLRAGLFPLLRGQHVVPVYIRLSHADDTPDLVAQVRSAIDAAARAAGVETPPRTANETLWEYFHRKNSDFWDARNRIVMPLLVFDQFEEIFTLGRASAERRTRTEAFLAELCDLVEGRPPQQLRKRLDANPEEALQFSLSDQPCKVLISLREDFLSDLTDLRERMPSIASTMYRLRPMTATEALRVVEVGGGRFVDRQVAERIVQFVGSAGSDSEFESGAAVVEPALLSVLCRELNNRRIERGDAKIQAELVEGDRAAIIADFYERTISAPGLSRAVRVFVEDELITDSGFRDNRAEEQALAGGITRAEIDTLIASRLLRREEVGAKGRSRLELTHDVLTEPVRVSRDKRVAGERQRQELEQQQTAAKRAREEADRARQAAETAEALARQEQRARASAERLTDVERRSRRRQFVWLSVVLVAVGSLGLYGWQQAVQANAAEAEAKRASSAADLGRVAGGEPWALAFLARAVRNDPDSVGARALLIGHLSQHVVRLAKMPHGGPLKQAALNATGTRILTTGEDERVILWDARTGQRIAGLDPTRRFKLATFTLDGSRILTVGEDGVVQMLEAESGKVGPAWRQAETVSLAAVGNDGRQITIVSPDGTIRIRDVVSGEERIVEAGEKMNDLLSDPTGVHAVSISTIGDLRIWHLASAAQVAHIGSVSQAAFSPDGSHIIVALTSDEAQLIETRTGRSVGAPMKADGSIVGVGFDPRGDRVITTSYGSAAEGSSGIARLWDARTAAPLARFTHDGGISFVAFSPDSTMVVTASPDRTARLWEASTGKPIGRPLRHAYPVFFAGFSPDGRRVLTVLDDGTARLWDAGTGFESTGPLRHNGQVASAAFSSDGATVVTASKDGIASVWDARTGMSVATRLRHGDRFRISLAAISRDGTHAATAGHLDATVTEEERARRIEEERTARVWETTTGRIIGAGLRHADAINSLEFDPHGTRIVTGSADHSARVWEVRTGASVGGALQHSGPVFTAKFSPDGTRVVTASDDRTARVWDAVTGKPIGAPLQHEAAVRWAVFSPNGAQVVTASDDSSARVWEAATGKLVRELPHESPVFSAAFRPPDGLQIVTSLERSARLWDLKEGQSIGQRLDHQGGGGPAVFNDDGTELVTLPDAPMATVWDIRGTPRFLGQLRHPENMVSAAFAGRRLLTASIDGLVPFWDTASRQQFSFPLRHAGRLDSVVLSADGSRVLTVENNGLAWVWDLPVATSQDAEHLAELAELVGGHRLRQDGTLEDYPEPERTQRLSGWRERLAGLPDTSVSLLTWFVADPGARTISPLSQITVPEYISRLLAEGDSGRREAQRLFPGHPAHANANQSGSPNGASRPQR